MEMPVDTPALDHLLGSYFHQDWRRDGTEHEVLETFMADEPDLAVALPPEIDDLLSGVPADEDLGRVLLDKGGQYAPRSPAGGSRAWLQEVARLARAHLQGQ